MEHHLKLVLETRLGTPDTYIAATAEVAINGKITKESLWSAYLISQKKTTKELTEIAEAMMEKEMKKESTIKNEE